MAFLDENGLIELWSIIKHRLSLVAEGVAEISVTVLSSSGSPISGVAVTGVFDDYGITAITDSNGKATGYVASGSTTIGISGYADIEDASLTETYTKGSNYAKTLTVTTRNFLKLTSSQNLKFSGNVARLDVTAVGGGGSGAKLDLLFDNGSVITPPVPGGGGGYCTVKENVSFVPNTSYSAFVGAGGIPPVSYTHGVDGGESSLLGVVAAGGKGPGVETMGGAGNGRGAYGSATYSGVYTGYNAVAGSVAGYSSFTETVMYGGGGGAGQSWASEYVGAGYGGKNNGARGTDGFGGGGAGAQTQSADHQQTLARGGSGCIAIRMHLKAA